VDVRVIAATNWNVEQARDQGRLRDDVYFRLSVIRVEIPPLRQRLEDLSLLVNHFMSKHAKSSERRLRRIAPDAFKAMLAYPWPGNVRELESVIESAYALGSDESLKLSDLPTHLWNHSSERALTPTPVQVASNENQSTSATAKSSGVFSLDAVEKEALIRALQVSHGNKSKAAQLLGVSRKRLYRMLYEYGLSEGDTEL
jgi:DNA-binding NtrC family response regulator